MPDFMLTTLASNGAVPKDIQVNNAGDIREAIELAEASLPGMHVCHGRGGIGSEFDPNWTIDAESGEVIHHHDNVSQSGTLGVPDYARRTRGRRRP